MEEKRQRREAVAAKEREPGGNYFFLEQTSALYLHGNSTDRSKAADHRSTRACHPDVMLTISGSGPHERPGL
jgi:hypothetical protein